MTANGKLVDLPQEIVDRIKEGIPLSDRRLTLFANVPPAHFVISEAERDRLKGKPFPSYIDPLIRDDEEPIQSMAQERQATFTSSFERIRRRNVVRDDFIAQMVAAEAADLEAFTKRALRDVAAWREQTYEELVVEMAAVQKSVETTQLMNFMRDLRKKWQEERRRALTLATLPSPFDMVGDVPVDRDEIRHLVSDAGVTITTKRYGDAEVVETDAGIRIYVPHSGEAPGLLTDVAERLAPAHPKKFSNRHERRKAHRGKKQDAKS